MSINLFYSMSNTIIEELSVLISRCNDNGMLGLKSEFESEGMRIDEFNLLNTLTKSNGLLLPSVVAKLKQI